MNMRVFHVEVLMHETDEFTCFSFHAHTNMQVEYKGVVHSAILIFCVSAQLLIIQKF